ncbi:MAG: phage virion morphogenesis protein [Deltaproteobacteria bacterium]|nr:phage virion morphogenesis protein [Deltaproteobacteria bacterium]
MLPINPTAAGYGALPTQWPVGPVDSQAVLDLLERIQARLGHMRPAMEKIGDVIVESVLENFQKEGRPTKWKKWSDTTILLRKKMTPSKDDGTILKLMGPLVRSNNYKAADDSVTVFAGGAAAPYAALQQFGSNATWYGQATIKAFRRKVRGKYQQVKTHQRWMKTPWGPVPARPFLMIQDQDWDAMRQQLMEWLRTNNI